MAKKPTAAQLATLADQYWTQRQHRLEREREIKLMKAAEDKLFENLQQSLKAAGVNGCIGNYCSANVEEKPKVTVDDWAGVRDFVLKHGAWDLYQNRIAEAAVLERQRAGQAIPGVSVTISETLSIKKV